jgi:hypothetical protein
MKDPQRDISSGRKTAYYAGLALVIIGLFPKKNIKPNGGKSWIKAGREIEGLRRIRDAS